MKKLIYGVLFMSILGAPAMAMQNGNNQNNQYQNFPTNSVVEINGRRVKLVSKDVPSNPSGLEFIDGIGWWVKVLRSNNGSSSRQQSSLSGKLTDEVLAHILPFEVAMIIAWLKKEAVDYEMDGYVELEPIIVDLLSNGVWKNINDIPGTLLSLSLDNTWKNDEKDLIEAAGKIFTRKFTEKYEDDTVDTVEDFVEKFGIDGLYVDPQRISKILHDSAKKWDEASGVRTSSSTRGSTSSSSSSDDRTRGFLRTAGVEVSENDLNDVIEILKGYHQDPQNRYNNGTFAAFLNGFLIQLQQEANEKHLDLNVYIWEYI